MSSFQGVSEAIRAKGLFCSLYADRASPTGHARGRRQGGQGHPDPGRPRPGAARHRVDPGLLARGTGGARSACSAPCRSAASELRLAGITDMVEANRFLKEVFLPHFNARFATPAEDRGTAFVPFTGFARRHPVHPRGTHRSNDNTVRYKRLALQIPAGRHRRHYVKARVRVHEYPDGTMAVFGMDRDVWRDTTPMANRSTAKPARPRDPLRRDRPAPCGRTAAPRPTTSPQGQKPQQKRSTHIGTPVLRMFSPWVGLRLLSMSGMIIFGGWRS